MEWQVLTLWDCEVWGVQCPALIFSPSSPWKMTASVSAGINQFPPVECRPVPPCPPWRPHWGLACSSPWQCRPWRITSHWRVSPTSPTAPVTPSTSTWLSSSKVRSGYWMYMLMTKPYRSADLLQALHNCWWDKMQNDLQEQLLHGHGDPVQPHLRHQLRHHAEYGIQTRLQGKFLLSISILSLNFYLDDKRRGVQNSQPWGPQRRPLQQEDLRRRPDREVCSSPSQDWGTEVCQHSNPELWDCSSDSKQSCP